MSVDFKIKDFFYPIPILRLRSFLETSQWFSEEELRDYQRQRLNTILRHAYANVPYYRDLFDGLKLKPWDFKSLDDLKKIPLLTKDILRKNFGNLIAKNARKYNPFLCKTSGTSGEPVRFYLDRSSNVLEFCYYWRHWSWAGYRLGTRFAEFSIHHFINTGIKEVAHFSRAINRLALNPSQISYENIGRFAEKIKKYKPLFLKGSPSTVYIFAILLEKRRIADLSFKAIFTTGESQLSYQREKIEKVFNCKILDSYGHMERTVAVSQCTSGRYHVHSEYGILEIDKNERLSSDGKTVGDVIGTSLHNFAMPFIRYKTGDLAEVAPECNKCECKRALPVIERIHGRSQDLIFTADGRFITNLFVLFNLWSGISWFQFIQEDANSFRLKLAKDSNFSEIRHAVNLKKLKEILGGDAMIYREFVELKDIEISEKKYRPIVSKMSIRDCVK